MEYQVENLKCQVENLGLLARNLEYRLKKWVSLENPRFSTNISSVSIKNLGISIENHGIWRYSWNLDLLYKMLAVGVL